MSKREKDLTEDNAKNDGIKMPRLESPKRGDALDQRQAPSQQ